MLRAKNHYRAGVFSCSSVLLMQLLDHFKHHKTPINFIDGNGMFSTYKNGRDIDLYPIYYKIDSTVKVDCTKDVRISLTDSEPQFSDYSLLNFKELSPYIQKYFSLSDIVLEKKRYITEKYKITENMCAIMFRGNDKCTETNVPSYQEFINKAKEFKLKHPDINFYVQTDECEFLNLFLNEFPDSIYVDEIPRMQKNVNTCVPYVMDKNMLLESSIYYTASIKLMSEMKYIITTSGNGESWILYFRGNSDRVTQYLSPIEYYAGVKNKDFDPNKTNFWINVSM